MEPPPVILSPVKDGRRVLGEKTTNASMSPTRRQRNVDSAVTADIPLKPLHESPSPRKIILPRCHAGQKRTIDEVEDTNNPEPRTRLFAGLKQQREEGCEIHNKNTQSTVDSEDQVRGQLLNKAQGSICTDVGHCYRTWQTVMPQRLLQRLQSPSRSRKEMLISSHVESHLRRD